MSACVCREKEADEGLKWIREDVKGKKKGRRWNKEKKKGGIVRLCSDTCVRCLISHGLPRESNTPNVSSRK